jgi:hypothetical protein
MMAPRSLPLMKSLLPEWTRRLVGLTPEIRTRTDLLNYLISSHGYARYLEIGVRDPADNFDRVAAQSKVGVDPSPVGEVTHSVTSDAFFNHLARGTRFDLIFIDGLHLEEQVLRDVANSLDHLAVGGRLVVHDCNPTTAEMQIDEFNGTSIWTGTVWKAWAQLRSSRADLAMCVVDVDYGCGVITRGSQRCFATPLSMKDVDYEFLERHRRRLLNLVSASKFVRVDRRQGRHQPTGCTAVPDGT